MKEEENLLETFRIENDRLLSEVTKQRLEKEALAEEIKALQHRQEFYEKPWCQKDFHGFPLNERIGRITDKEFGLLVTEWDSGFWRPFLQRPIASASREQSTVFIVMGETSVRSDKDDGVPKDEYNYLKGFVTGFVKALRLKDGD